MQNKILYNLCRLIKQSGAYVNVRAVGVAGSIGRGEQTIEAKNLNDVDFVVIGSKKSLNKELSLCHELNKSLGTEFTTVFVISEYDFLNSFNKKKLSQSNYDLIRDIVFYNKNIEFEEEYMKSLQNIKPQSIELSSGVTVLTTRAWVLWSRVSIESKNNNKEFFNNQLNKFLSAIVDAALIFEGVYSGGTKIEKRNKFKTTTFWQKLDEESKFKFKLFYLEKLNEKYLEDKYKFCISLNIKTPLFGNYGSRHSIKIFISYLILLLKNASKFQRKPFIDLINYLRVKRNNG